jgi:hypothetical protein
MVVACIALATTLSGVATAAERSLSDVPNNSVSTAKIQNGAVITSKIKDAAVIERKIANGAVTTAKIANGAVTNAKIADGAVSAAKIADDAVGSDQIEDGSITADDLEDGLLDVQEDSVNSASIEDGSITNDDLGDDSVGGWNVLDGSLDGDDIDDGTLGSEDIDDGSLLADDIDQTTLTEIDAATLGGLTADEFVKVPAPGHDAYTASGLAWLDQDGLNMTRVQSTYEGRTTWCTRTGTGDPSASIDLHLPHGAIITELNVDYIDDAGATTTNGTARITRQPIFSGSGDGVNQTVFSADLQDPGTGFQGLPRVATSTRVPAGFPGFPNTPPIDNLTYAYSITAHPALAATAVCAARVVYELP